MLRGALAAAVTPLRDDGAALDEEAFRPYLDFLAAAGLDGILALGTTGEGILLSAAERRRVRERAPTFRGLKVSDRPFEAVEPYLLDGLDVFVGAEELVLAGLARGAAG